MKKKKNQKWVGLRYVCSFERKIGSAQVKKEGLSVLADEMDVQVQRPNPHIENQHLPLLLLPLSTHPLHPPAIASLAHIPAVGDLDSPISKGDGDIFEFGRVDRLVICDDGSLWKGYGGGVVGGEEDAGGAGDE